MNVGDPRGRIWQQRGETFEAFEKRVKAAAEVVKSLPDAFALFTKGSKLPAKVP